jgi:hypothetical protein
MLSFQTEVAEKASRNPATKRKKLSLEKKKRKCCKIINDDICVQFYMSFIFYGQPEIHAENIRISQYVIQSLRF